jgi:Tol biopolymer transport system component
MHAFARIAQQWRLPTFVLVAATVLGLILAQPATALTTWPGRIAYNGTGNMTNGLIYTMAADGTDIVGLTPGNPDIAAGACWAPGQARLAYSYVTDAQGHIRVWTMDADGTDKAQVAYAGPWGGWTAPTIYGRMAWSPSGRYLVYEDYKDSRFCLVAIDLTHHTSFVVTRATGAGHRYDSVKFTPDGKKLLTVESNGAISGTMRLIRFAPNASTFKTYAFAVRSADLSFAGTLVAYVPGNSDQLMTCNPATGRTRRLLVGAHGTSPQWSRNGAMVAYEQGAAPWTRIYTARPTRKGVSIRNLDDGMMPAW